jgi:hypothetical protein
VDTEAKRKFDESIREARMRREDIEREARELGEEEAKLNSEAEVVKAKLVCSCLSVWCAVLMRHFHIGENPETEAGCHRCRKETY